MIKIQNQALRRRETQEDWCEPGAASEGPRSPDVVYFLRYNRYIKIGYSGNLPKRLMQHRNEEKRKHLDSVEPRDNFQIIAAVNGTLAEENRVQSYFEDHRIGEEEFSHNIELTDYLRWLRQQWFTQVPEEGAIRDAPVVEYERWAPSLERRTPHIPDLFLDSTRYLERRVTGDDYYIDEDLAEMARRSLGGEIDLDPASHAAANRLIKAKKIHTLFDNGLLHPWYGRIWLNPPFSKYSAFAKKLVSEWERGEIERTVALIGCNAITAKYMRPLLDKCSAVIVPYGRLNFIGPIATQTPNGHLVLIFAKEESDLDEMLDPFRHWAIFLSR